MKKLIFILPVLMLTGCFNMSARIASTGYRPFPYECTCEAARMVTVPFRGHDGADVAAGIIFWPLWVVDVPCEVVLDTVFLPFDWYRKNKKLKHDKQCFCDLTDEERKAILTEPVSTNKVEVVKESTKKEDEKLKVVESNKVTIVDFKDPRGERSKIAICGARVKRVKVTVGTNTVEYIKK